MTTIPAQQSHISGLCGTPRARWGKRLPTLCPRELFRKPPALAGPTLTTR